MSTCRQESPGKKADTQPMIHNVQYETILYKHKQLIINIVKLRITTHFHCSACTVQSAPAKAPFTWSSHLTAIPNVLGRPIPVPVTKKHLTDYAALDVKAGDRLTTSSSLVLNSWLVMGAASWQTGFRTTNSTYTWVYSFCSISFTPVALTSVLHTNLSPVGVSCSVILYLLVLKHWTPSWTSRGLIRFENDFRENSIPYRRRASSSKDMTIGLFLDHSW